MSHWQQENKNHVLCCVRTEWPVPSQDYVLYFREKEDEELLFWWRLRIHRKYSNMIYFTGKSSFPIQNFVPNVSAEM